MAGTSEGARKGAERRLAKLRADGGEEAVSEYYAKLAAKSNNKKSPKRGLAALKESNPEKFKEITSMGGKNRWNPSKKRIEQKQRSDDLQHKLKAQRKQELEKLRAFDELNTPKPKPKPKKPKTIHNKPVWGEEDNTGW